ncbi:BTB/POZ domain-containing protein [Actinidia chinensis var. chinensis]|uniref:BTB/POZ domain-containing protein n=1 Tax=Actinidia chinensis var. chinensis TaxID=1590841 RepID=A0A2R6S340_ACTCC|nr:BTB/POZ domain-containing protein [Actinidia chinensis var. chinensis]
MAQSGRDSDGNNLIHNQGIIVPANLITIADSFEKKEHSWFVTSHIPTDLSIQIQGITFHVHKYPLVSRCGYLSQVELQPSNSNLGCNLKLENLPGGSETFEIILKFCYGLPISLNPNNVAALRCASEFLEMSEALEDGNLISKTEAFLTFVVLSSWRETITVLRSCETLSPWAENLQIVRRCCDSIARKASREKPTGEMINEESWWFEDSATLRIDHFVRIITALKAKGLKPEIIGSCIMYYAGKWLPGMDVELDDSRKYIYIKNELRLNILSGRRHEGNVGHNKEQKMIIESLVSILPPQKEAVSCKFLLEMLKMALVYSASPALVSELEKRVGMVLENADANDLLVPSCTRDQGKTLNSPDECTMHNIDVVQRILEYFLMHEHEHEQQQQQKSGKMVSKLLDNYLAEVAKDPNLSITKFQALAEALPVKARTCHDGIYRAIDTYLKSHPSLSEHERRRLCKIMDCKKLSLDACIHAAQNDRLPLRTIMQVLLSEQIKMRAVMQGKEQAASGNNSDQEESWTSKEEIKILKDELLKVKAEMQGLQKDYTELQRIYGNVNNKRRSLSGWTLGWRKIKNSGFFNRKMEGDETRVEQQRSTSSGLRVSLRRRLSMF